MGCNVDISKIFKTITFKDVITIVVWIVLGIVFLTNTNYRLNAQERCTQDNEKKITDLQTVTGKQNDDIIKLQDSFEFITEQLNDLKDGQKEIANDIKELHKAR